MPLESRPESLVVSTSAAEQIRFGLMYSLRSIAEHLLANGVVAVSDIHQFRVFQIALTRAIVQIEEVQTVPVYTARQGGNEFEIGLRISPVRAEFDGLRVPCGQDAGSPEIRMSRSIPHR